MLSASGRFKEICIYVIVLLTYISRGISRTYSSFLFHQLGLPDSKITLDNDQKTWIASSLGFLCPVGSILSGILADSIGRINNMFFTFLPFVISWGMIALANSYHMLLAAEVIQGVGLGMIGFLSAYVSEIASVKYRGIVLASMNVTLNFGIILCNSLMYFIMWDIVSLIFCIFSIMSVVVTRVLPESPIWLYTKGRTDEAIRSLCTLRHTTPDKLVDEIQDMEKTNSSRENRKMGFRVTIKTCLNAWRQLLLTLILYVLVIQAGYSVLLPYTVQMVDWLQIPFYSPTVALVYSVVSFIASIISPLFMHCFKRKTMLTISAVGTTLTMLCICVYEELFLHEKEKPLVWIVPVALCLYTLFNNIGNLPIALMIGAEIYPTEVKGTLFGIYGCIVYTYWASILKLYPMIHFNFGVKALVWAFFGNSLLLLLFALFLLPETKGKTLNEIQEQYFKKIPKAAPV